VKKLFLFGLFSLWLPIASAQGTLYSSFGIGELSYYPTSQSGAMGYTSLAVLNPYYINHTNPALLSGLSETRISGLLNYSGYSAAGSLGSGYGVAAGFGGLGLAFPVGNSFVFASGIYPYSRLNYTQQQTGIITVPEVGTSGYTFTYSGNGGLSQVPLSVGFEALTSRKYGSLRLGVGLSFLFGTFERRRENRYTNSAIANADASFLERASGLTQTAGAVYSKIGLFRRADVINLAASFTTGSDLSGQRETTRRTGPINDSLSNGDGTVSLPLSLGFGLAYSPNDKSTLAADLTFQNWSNFQYFSESNANVSYRNALRFGLGYEYLPSRERRDSFFARTAYRIGAYSNQTYLQFANSTGLDELGVTGGFAFPIGGEASRLDVNFGYSRRGSITASGIQENIFRFGFSLNAGDRWFVKLINSFVLSHSGAICLSCEVIKV
jgi:hypothetical protein